MQPSLSNYVWVSLSNEQRNRIRSIFLIPRSSHTVVNDGRIESDGTTYEDLKHLTIEKMQVYLKEESTDFHKLFDMIIARINDELIEKKPIVIDMDEPITVIIEPKKRGRPSKK